MKLADIAKMANVSKSTASLVLNGKPGVSDAKRAEILKLLEDSNYVRLRQPAQAKTPTNSPKVRFVAGTNEDVVSLDYQQPFFNELIAYISSEINAAGLSLLMSIFPKDSLLEDIKNAELEEPSLGIILLGTNLTSALLRPISEAFENLVIIDTESSGIDCNTVTMNNFLGSFTAANYLLDLGHQKIGYIKGRPRINNFFDRRRGFVAALNERDIDVEHLTVFQMRGMQLFAAEQHLEALLYFAKSVTAIFCENDYIALSLIKLLQQNEISVPDDVSVIGFDDIHESWVITPELTTVHVPLREIANETVRLLHSKIESSGNKQAKKQIFLNPELIVRNSVKNLRHANKKIN